MAREQLRLHAGKTISARLAGQMTSAPLLTIVLRVAREGIFEIVGSGSAPSDINASNSAPNPEFDVSISIALKLIPRLLRGEAAAFSEVEFSGDSEFAATLSTIARNVQWDVEQDLSRVVGDIAAHRIVGAAKSLNAWQLDTKVRLTENLAEYLTEEKHAFITGRELGVITVANETLRDDLARLEARLHKLSRPA